MEFPRPVWRLIRTQRNSRRYQGSSKRERSVRWCRRFAPWLKLPTRRDRQKRITRAAKWFLRSAMRTNRVPDRALGLTLCESADNRLGVVQPTVIDHQSAVGQIFVNLDETAVKQNVLPAVVVMRLHCGRNDGFNADDRSEEKNVSRAHGLACFAVKRTAFVNEMTQGQSGRENNCMIQLQLQRIKASDRISLHRRLFTGKQHFELSFDHAVVPKV